MTSELLVDTTPAWSACNHKTRARLTITNGKFGGSATDSFKLEANVPHVTWVWRSFKEVTPWLCGFRRLGRRGWRVSIGSRLESCLLLSVVTLCLSYRCSCCAPHVQLGQPNLEQVPAQRVSTGWLESRMSPLVTAPSIFLANFLVFL
jgi:hypothetical protein